MGRGLILVRHAMPAVSEELPSTMWPLAESSERDCAQVALALPIGLAPVVYSSNQPKSEATAAAIAGRLGLTWQTDEAFREVDKPEEWFADNESYRKTVAAYLRDGGRPGWEAPPAVAKRFGDGAERALAANATGDLIIVNHGMALSLYLASMTAIGLVPFWQALTFPDAWRLDLETDQLTHLFRGGPKGL